MLKIIDSGMISHQTGRGAYMPVITPLADGGFIACQHVGQGLGTPDNHIEVLRSMDGGITWVNEGNIHPGGTPTDGWSYRGPMISEVPDGRLVMNATRFESEGGTLFDRNRKPCSVRRCCYSGQKIRAKRGQSRSQCR